VRTIEVARRENDERRCSVKALGSRRIGILILLAVTICFVAAATFLRQPTWLFHWSDFRTGNRIIAQVEAFRQSHGRLPETLEEVGITDPNPRVFYRKTNDHEYVVWFGISVGESEAYDSSTRKWD
jgi:hypothetical protein